MNQNLNGHQKPKKVLNTDIIWSAIAIALLIGVILFFFDGLQPLILSNYISGANNQVVKLNNKLADQTQSFTNLEADILDKLKPFDPIEVCSPNQSVDTKSSSFTEFRDFKTKLLPDPELASVPRYSVFYLKNVESKYTNLYAKYESVLTKYHEVYKTGLSFIDFIEYRNFWIKNCQDIQASKGNFTKLKQLCALQKEKYETFADKNIYPDSQKLVTASLNNCTQVEKFVIKPANKDLYPNFNQWFSNWYTGFQNLMLYEAEFTPGIQELKTVTDNFNIDTKNTLDDILFIKNSKNSFISKFYLIDFDTK